MKKIIGILMCGVLLFALPAHSAAQNAALSSGDFQYEVTAENTATILRYTGSRAEPEIPGVLGACPVTKIGESAFRDCGFLEKAMLPESIEVIGAQAFYNCTALTDILLPLSLREIGDLAFAYCVSLQKVMILEGVRSIGEYAFGDCSNLSVITVPASVSAIGPDAFAGVSADFSLFASEGGFAQEYAAANGIPFMVLTEDPNSRAAGTETETATESAEAAETPEDIVTATITVRFPHADRTGTYTGEMQNGEANGEGTFTATNDEGVSWTYTGAWENGMMNGYGTMSWSDGLGFEGTYRENQPTDGQWLIDGAVVYTGGFMMCPQCGVSVFHGAGQLYNRLGKLIFEGEFESGYLKETAEARTARATALDPLCERLTEEGYLAALQAPDAPSGQLVKLEGRIGSIPQEEGHGYTELFVLNNGNGAYPIRVSYRYGVDEEKAETGRVVTVWGAIVGVHRYTDSDGKAQAMPLVDADVIAMSQERPQRGAAEITIAADKVLAGRPLKNREFSFVLNQTFTVIEERVNPVDGSDAFVPVTYTRQMQTKSNGRDGKITFDPIRFTAADIGKALTYTVTEVPVIEAGMACDPMVMTVTAIIADNGGVPAATVVYPPDTVFDNAFTQPVPDFSLLQVDVDRTAIMAGETVTWTPVVNGGIKPYAYHYRLMKDGIQYKDYGWVKDAAKSLKLSKAGTYVMEVTVRDADKALTQTLSSLQVKVKAAFTAKELSGEWTGNHDYLVYTGSGTTKPLPQKYECTMTLKMGTSGTGTISISFAGFSGTATYKNGVFKATMRNQWCTDLYEGTLSIANGVMTLSGTLSETQKSEHAYTGTFSFTKPE